MRKRTAITRDFLRVFAGGLLGELLGDDLCGVHCCSSFVAPHGPCEGTGCPLQVIHPRGGVLARLDEGYWMAWDDRVV